MRAIFVLIFVVLTANLIAEEPQTKIPPKAGLSVQTRETKQIYDEADFPSGTFEGLTDVQKKEALEALNSNPCTCGCSNDTIAICRIKDPNCGVAPKLVAQVLGLVREGKDAKAVGAELQKAKLEAEESENLDVEQEQESIFIPIR